MVYGRHRKSRRYNKRYKKYNNRKYKRNYKRPELKYYDKTVSLNLDSNGSNYALNDIVQGLTAGTRVGNSICMKRLIFKGNIRVPTVATANQAARICIVRDKANNNAVPPAYSALAPQIFSDLTVESMRKPENMGRFRVYRSQRYDLAGYPQEDDQLLVNYNIKMNSIARYTGNAGTAADLTTNALFMLVVGDETPGITSAVLTGKVRLYYTDM